MGKLKSVLIIFSFTMLSYPSATSQITISVAVKQVRLNNFEVGFHNFYKGKLYFNDGSTKNGEISFPINNKR
jgi:hypothetical protein